MLSGNPIPIAVKLSSLIAKSYKSFQTRHTHFLRYIGFPCEKSSKS